MIRDSEPRVARFFTPVRRIPLLVGKIGQQKLPFGPYTFMQLLIGAVTAFIGWNTMSLWGPIVGSSPIARLAALLIISVGSILLAAAIPATKRKPHYVAMDTFHAFTSAPVGTYNGDSIRVAKPHQVAGIVLLAREESAPIPSVAEAPQRVATQPVPQRARAAMASPSLSFQTGLDRLLEQARGGNQ